MAKHFEGHFRGFDGTELFFQAWQQPEAQKTMIIVHGQGEHSGSYEPFVERQLEYGWDVFACDLRGHGRSDGQRGFVSSIDEYEKDLFIFIQLVKSDIDKKSSLVLFGHSLGGLVCCKNLIAYGDQSISALSLSAPLWGLSLEAPEWKKQAAHFLKMHLPRLTLGNEISYEDLTRDPKFIESFEKDPLRHNKVSPRLYTGMLDSFEQLPKFLSEIKIPTLIQISDNDPVVDSQKVQENFPLLGSAKKDFKIYKDNKHEIFNDLDRDQIFADQNEFLNSILSRKKT